MSEMKDRLKRGAEILERIDRKRADTHSPSLGYDTEFLIIHRELRELENDILADPGALQAQLVRVRRKKADGPTADAQ